MRLIDADEFQKHYCKENCGERQCIDAMDKCLFIDCLNDFPTAFDVDKVVEELENFRDEHTNDDGSSWYEADLMSQMIEIVRRGGLNE